MQQYVHGTFSRRLPLSSLHPPQLGLQSNNREETQPCPTTENWVKDLLSMVLPIKTRTSFPPQSVSPTRKLGLVLMGRALLTLLHSVPPALLQDIVDPCLCWRLLDTQGKSGSVSCGVTDPFSWVLVHTRFCLCPPRVCFPVLCKFWRLYGGVNGDLLQEGLCHTQACCTQSPCPAAVHC